MCFRLAPLLLSVSLVVVNLGFYRSPAVGSGRERQEVRAQLRHLEEQVHGGLGERMQALFPEGSAFTHALYGLAWCGYAHAENDTAVTRHALAEALWAYERLDDPALKGLFPKVMEPKYGVFYAGWRNYLLARIIGSGYAGLSPGLIEEFDAQSAELKRAYLGSDSPFLPSYDGMAWPADNVVAVASLAIHQRIRMDEGDGVLERWLRQADGRMDERGCIPHAWDPVRDRMVEASRGCSQSLMNCFLPFVDSALARGQFERFKEHFLDTRFGVPMVREFAKGCSGTGDVDSGPVIFGAGSSATIVGPGAFRMNRDPSSAHGLAASIEAFGVPIGTDRKRYVLGLLPIADLFIVWTRTMGDTPTGDIERPSYTVLHLWSAFFVLLSWSPLAIIRRWRRKE